MNILTTTLFASIAMAATSFAGHEMVSSGKDFKDKKVIAPTYCFNAGEVQLDVFGAYQVGNGGSHAGPINNHGFGGGVGVNYFFTRYLGIGAEGYWIASDHNGDQNAHGETTFHNVNGNLIFRLPIDAICLAPYAYLGGGAVMDGDKWAVAFGGVGLEYRVIPNKLGVFVDARWNYYGDRYDNGVENNFTTRAGLRWVF